MHAKLYKYNKIFISVLRKVRENEAIFESHDDCAILNVEKLYCKSISLINQ